jgi:hypothetical protein
VRNSSTLLEEDITANYDFSKTCVEPSRKHRLTTPDTLIRIYDNSVVSGLDYGGFWRNRIASNGLAAYTRAHLVNDPQKSRTDPLIWWQDYDFHWSPALKGLSARNLDQAEPTTICNVGWSHARELTNAMEDIGFQNGKYNVNVLWGGAKYPTEVTSEFIMELVERFDCKKLVVAVGQWPASYRNQSPTLLGDYYNQMRIMFRNMLETVPSNVEIYARSIHHIPMGDRISICSPKDWRTPAVIDGYNAVLRKVSEEMTAITFIDTTFLVSPVWDTAPDWCHLADKVAHKEALYIAGVALGAVDVATKSVMNSVLKNSVLKSVAS